MTRCMSNGMVLVERGKETKWEKNEKREKKRKAGIERERARKI